MSLILLFFITFITIDYERNNFIGGGSAPNFHQQHYPEAPEPIIEIIIQDNNETLPEPQPIIQSSGKKKKEQVQVFYVKYHKDEHKGLVIHEPVAALSPAGYEQGNDNDDSYDEPIIVTPTPNIPRKATTLRTIIRPDSEQHESSNGVHVSFNRPHNHHSKSDNHIQHHHDDEDKVESAIRLVIQLPQSRIGPLPVIPLKEKRQQPPIPAHLTQGRVVNSPPPQQQQQQQNFHLPPQQLVQPLPNQRPHAEFNPQNNFIAHSQQGILSNHLQLPSQDPSKPFHQNVQFNHQQQHSQQHVHQQHLQNQHIQQTNRNPQPIPINHQQSQFNQQQGILAHQQFNQPPQRLPPPQLTQQQLPQRPPVSANFNQNQRPFNYHAHTTQPQLQQAQSQPQLRFPPPPPNAQQQQQFALQQQQSLQRPQQILPPRQNPQANFHNQNQQSLPLNRPPLQFNPSQQFPIPPPPSQQFLPHQGPPLNFKPEAKIIQQQHQQPIHHTNQQPLHQHNQFASQQIHHQNQNVIHENHNIFQGGLVEQKAPNLAGARPHFTQQQTQPQPQPQSQFQSHEDSHFHQQNHQFIQTNFGTDVQVSSSVPKFEHHIIETVNPPVHYQPTAVDMEKFSHEKNIGPLAGNIGHLPVTQQTPIFTPENHQHRFAVNSQQHQQQSIHHEQQQLGGVSNHFSQVFPQIENQQQQQFSSQPSFLELNGRNNHNHNNNNFISASPHSSASPSTTPPTTRKIVQTTKATTEKPQAQSSTKKPNAYFDLPDEIPDDLRKQLEESGVLENAQISILDYDKIGETSLQDLPPEHLANFFSSGN